MRQNPSTRRAIQDEGIVIASVFRWIVIAIVLGVTIGASVAGFLYVLNAGIAARANFPSFSSLAGSPMSFIFLLLPLVFFFNILIAKLVAPEAEGNGDEKIISAIHRKGGQIRARVVPLKTIMTIITLVTGGSVGKESPGAQIGAGIASSLTQLLRIPKRDRKRLVVCGVSAGFAAVFGTPVAGAIFALEFLVIGSLLYEILLPALIAALIASQTASFLGIGYAHYSLQTVPALSQSFFLQLILASVFFASVAALFIESLHGAQRLEKRIRLWRPIKGLLAGITLLLLAYVFSPQYLGLGEQTINHALRGDTIIWYAFLLKIVFTSITLAFGGSGGIITPIIFTGATAGAIFAQLFGLDNQLFAALGFIGVLAGATNTPLAASIMAIELFGSRIAPAATLIAVLSFFLTGYRSVFSTQILGMRKAPTSSVKIGKTLSQVTNRTPYRHSILRPLFTRPRKTKE